MAALGFVPLKHLERVIALPFQYFQLGVDCFRQWAIAHHHPTPVLLRLVTPLTLLQRFFLSLGLVTEPPIHLPP